MFETSWWLVVPVAVASCLLVLLVDATARWRKRAGSRNYPPGPPGLPLIGNLLQVGRLVRETGFHWAAWSALAKLYGPVLRVRLAMAEPLVIVSGRDAVLEFLGKRELDGRPDTFEMRNRCLGKRRGLVCTDGPDYTELKKFALKGLKDFGYGRQQPMEKLLLQDVRLLCSLVREKLLDRVVDVHDFVEISSIAVVSSLWNIMAGARCDPAEPDSEIFKTLRILKESFRNGSTSGSLWQHLPLLRFIMPKYSGFTDQNERVNTLAKFFLDEVARHKETWTRGEPRDLIDKYLDEIAELDENGGSGKSYLNDELQLNVLVRDLFSAAIDTSSSTLGFAVAYLARNPGIQEKVHRELDELQQRLQKEEEGQEGQKDEEEKEEEVTISMDQKARLPYLNAVIAEVQRLASVAPTTIAHRALSDCTVMGFAVDKDWSVIGDLRGIHMDPEHWAPDPQAFRPERFIEPESGRFFEDPWLIPFGAGRRKCLGENLARMSLFLFHASLLQNFRFELAPGGEEPSDRCMLGINGFVISPPHVKLVIRSRAREP